MVKPSRTEAGLRVIPWDRLREKSPRVFNLCRRSGASRLYSLRDGGTLYFSDWSGVIWHEEDLEIEDVMETPEVGPGDLLLLSLNNIHATQTTEDRRLAVSLRTCDPATPIDWHRVAGSPTPRMMQYLGGMKGNLAPNKLFFPVFQATQENDFGITLADVLPTLTGELRVAEPMKLAATKGTEWRFHPLRRLSWRRRNSPHTSADQSNTCVSSKSRVTVDG